MLSGMLSLALLGCAQEEGPTVYAGPQLDAASLHLDLGLARSDEPVEAQLRVSNGGDLPLGISTIGLASAERGGSGHGGAFALQWSVEDIEVAEDALPVEQEEGLAAVLAPGAVLPINVSFEPSRVGDNYDAVVVRSADGAEDGQFPLRAHRDNLHSELVVSVHGVGEADGYGVPSLPSSVDMGFAFEGRDPVSVQTQLENLGAGPLELLHTDLEDCNSGFLLETAPSPGSVLLPGESMTFGLRYLALHEDPALCRLNVHMNDGIGEVSRQSTFEVNSDLSCPDEPPTVEILSPEPTELYSGAGPLELEVRVRDSNQPNSTLVCRVGSAMRVHATLASCTPPDGSGHCFVEVPLDNYATGGWGSEVFELQVEDACGQQGRDAVVVRLNSDFPDSDEDGDGVGTVGSRADCDDDDPAVFPAANEVADGKDNDCDWLIDEGTSSYDDDGDTFSEAAGDCDDTRDTVYPGAHEVPDGRDQDCDGRIDEGTVHGDDDMDGFSTVEGDCDDEDREIHPTAQEICGNWVDDNCNGLRDDEETCVEVDVDPKLIGGVRLSQDGVEPGESIEASVWVFDPDDDVVQVEWVIEEGTWELLSEDRILWTAPPRTDSEDWSIHIHKIQVRVTDARGGEDWSIAELWAWPKGGLEAARTDDAEPIKGGCATAPAASGWVLLLGLLGLRRRWR